MRLTLINQFYPPDLAPTGHLTASLAEHRAAQGDRVTVITSSSRYAGDRQGDAATRENPNLQVLRVSSATRPPQSVVGRAWQYLGFYAAAAWRLARLPRQDVIISLTTPPYIAWPCAVRKALKRDGRLILWNMDCYPDILEAAKLIRPGGLTARCLRWATRRLLRRVDAVVCLDDAMRALLRNQYAPADLPIAVIPNWEPLSAFPFDAEIAPWPKVADLGLQDRLLVLYLGNAGYGHEFGAVLDAAEALRDEPVSFLFVGGGLQRPHLERQARQRGLTNLVFHPYVPEDERLPVLAAADLALVTLADEALGMMSPSKLHAYLAMRLPVIYLGPEGSNVDGAIARFGCGASIRHGDAPALVRCLRAALHDRPLLASLQQKARTAFEEAYCDHATLPHFDRLLTDRPDGVMPRVCEEVVHPGPSGIGHG